ncbi:hypothetical protein ACFQAT_14605 [Undibacterium arcticum]|uniref:Uncharacterized protein n=1 Tax=Undibacterium arcticum TaxID=1762892 RepID=A0ABV7F4U3_9BURK
MRAVTLLLLFFCCSAAIQPLGDILQVAPEFGSAQYQLLARFNSIFKSTLNAAARSPYFSKATADNKVQV